MRYPYSGVRGEAKEWYKQTLDGKIHELVEEIEFKEDIVKQKLAICSRYVSAIGF